MLVISVLSFFFFVFGNWILSVTSPDEGKNLSAALNMLEKHDFIVPEYNCKPRFEKPPLFYWLTDVSFSLFGINEFSGRLVSGLSAVGVALLTYLFAMGVSPAIALTSSLIYMSFPHNWVETRAATPEMLLTFFMTLALFLLLKERYTLGWVAMALAFLTKGPVGVILPAGVYFLWKRNLRFLNPKGLIIFALISLPWYGAMLWRFGFDYFYKFFLYENVMRFTGHKSIHPYPFWYYLPIILANTVFFLPRVPRLIKSYDRRLNFFLLWFLVVLVFYSASKNKLQHYILFLYPPLAVMLSPYVGKRYVKAVVGICSVLIVSLFIYAHQVEKERFIPKFASYIKKHSERVFFYKTELSAAVFYARRCIPKIKSPSEIPQGALVITEGKFLKELPKDEVVLEGNEFGREFILLRHSSKRNAGEGAPHRGHS